MTGWLEWIIFSLGMVLAGVALLAFFINPLLVLLVAATFGLATWATDTARL